MMMKSIRVTAALARRGMGAGVGRRFRSSASGSVVVDNKHVVVVSRPVGPFQMNQYLVGCKRTKSAAFVDSGEDPAAFFAQCAKDHSLQVDHLLQTHAHIDHVMGLKATKELYPDAPIQMHKLDLPTYDLVELSSRNYGIPVEFPLPPIDIFLSDSLQVGKLHFDVIFTPGHAPGHCVFYCKEFNFAVVGDLIFQGSIGRTDLPNCSTKDMKKSIQNLVASLPDECLLLPGHGPVTSMAIEKAHNPYVKDWCS